MDEYEIGLTSKAEKDLKKLSKQLRERIVPKILALKNDRYPQHYKHLVGNKMAMYRLRIGDYRVIYDVYGKQKIVLIYRIGHRKDIYR